jgi:hypothetical protein
MPSTFIEVADLINIMLLLQKNKLAVFISLLPVTVTEDEHLLSILYADTKHQIAIATHARRQLTPIP